MNSDVNVILFIIKEFYLTLIFLAGDINTFLHALMRACLQVNMYSLLNYVLLEVTLQLIIHSFILPAPSSRLPHL